MTIRTAARAFAIAIAAALGISCDGPLTEVVVTVDTRLGVPCELDAIAIRSIYGEERMVLGQVTPETLPASATILGSGEADVEVTVVGLLAGQERWMARGLAHLAAGKRSHLHVVLTGDCTPEAPCSWGEGELPVFSSVPAPESRKDCNCTEGANCEPIIDRYRATEASFEPFRDACLVSGMHRTHILANADEMEAVAPAEIVNALVSGEFDFRFYGQRVSNLWVGDNGYVTFGSDAPMSTSPVHPGELDTAGVPRPGIAAFWERLRLRGEGVCIILANTSAIRRILITWKDACFTPCSPEDHLTFTVALEEQTDKIVVTYDRMESIDPPRAAGSGATVGITSSASPDQRPCSVEECGLDGTCMGGPNMGASCGFTQVFHGMAQPNGVVAFEFDPSP